MTLAPGGPERQPERDPVALARSRVQVAMRQRASWPPSAADVATVFDAHPDVVHDLISSADADETNENEGGER